MIDTAHLSAFTPTEHQRIAISPELRAFIDRVLVPALLDRFLREHAAQQPADIPAA